MRQQLAPHLKSKARPLELSRHPIF
jgi:hypothetical protein